MEMRKKSCRQGRRKFLPSMSKSNAAGGSGIEGVIVFGGALAIASLVAAFTIKKGRKDSEKETTNLAITDCGREEEDGSEGLRFILKDSSSTPHQNSCCTKHETSTIGITQIETCELTSTHSLPWEEKPMHCQKKYCQSINGQQEILISDTEQESIGMTDDYGDIVEFSRLVIDHSSVHEPILNVGKNESDDSSVMESIEIEIEDEAVDAGAKQTAEEKPTLQSSLSSASTEEEKCCPKQSSFSTEEEEEEYSIMQSSLSKEDDEEEGYSLMQSSFSTEEEAAEEEEYSIMLSSLSTKEDEEEGYSLMQSSFSTEEEEEEEEEEYSIMQSSLSTEDDDDEEYSPMRSSFSTEEEEYLPMRSSFSTEEEGYSPTESSFSTEEDEDSPLPSSFSTEGTESSSSESNIEAIWPADMMGVLSPESKEMNISHPMPVKKFEENNPRAKIKAYHFSVNMFNKSGSNNCENEKEMNGHVLMTDLKEHSASKQQIGVWIGLVLLLLLLLANCILQPNYLFNNVSLFFP